MAIPDLLPILNATNTQKNDQRLYDFLRRLLTEVQQTDNSVTRIVSSSGGGGGGTGFVTTTIGGVPTTIAMFTATSNIEVVTAAGISAALDLLP